MSRRRVRLVSNVPPFTKSRKDIIGDIALERREHDFLISEIRKLKIDMRFKDRVLQETLDAVESGLDYGNWPTMGELLRIVARIKAALEG